jgi:hypothetical protein
VTPGFVVLHGSPHHVDGCEPAGPALERRCALADQDLQTVDHVRPGRARCGEERGASGAVDHVDHAGTDCEGIGTDGQPLERVITVPQPDGGALHDQVGRLGLADGPPAKLRHEPLGALRRPVPDLHVGGAGPHERVHGGTPGAPGAQHERAAPRWRTVIPDRDQQTPHVCVVGMDAAALQREGVRGADGARRGRGLVGDGERRLLVRDRHVDAAEPGRLERPRGGGEVVRRDRQELVVPVLEPECAQRSVVHGRRARVRDRPAADAEARRHFVGDLPPLAARAAL